MVNMNLIKIHYWHPNLIIHCNNAYNDTLDDQKYIIYHNLNNNGIYHAKFVLITTSRMLRLIIMSTNITNQLIQNCWNDYYILNIPFTSTPSTTKNTDLLNLFFTTYNINLKMSLSNYDWSNVHAILSVSIPNITSHTNCWNHLFPTQPHGSCIVQTPTAMLNYNLLDTLGLDNSTFNCPFDLDSRKNSDMSYFLINNLDKNTLYKLNYIHSSLPYHFKRYFIHTLNPLADWFILTSANLTYYAWGSKYSPSRNAELDVPLSIVDDNIPSLSDDVIVFAFNRDTGTTNITLIVEGEMSLLKFKVNGKEFDMNKIQFYCNCLFKKDSTLIFSKTDIFYTNNPDKYKVYMNEPVTIKTQEGQIIENPFANAYMEITYTDKSQLEEVEKNGENVYSTKQASLIKFDMNEDIELDKILHVYSFGFITNKNITMTNKKSNRIVVFCDTTINNYKKEGDSEFTKSSDTDSVQINDAMICSAGYLTVKNLKLKNCTFDIRTTTDDQSLGNSLVSGMSIVDCTFLTKQKIEAYENDSIYISDNLKAFKSNTFLEGILLDNRLSLDKVEGKFLIKGDVSTYDNNSPDSQYGYIDIVENNSENQLKVERRTLHDDMSPYNIDLDLEKYTQVVLDDINKGSMYTSKLYSDKTSYLQWLCECQTKCIKGVIIMEKERSNINQFIENNKNKYDIIVSEISVENQGINLPFIDWNSYNNIQSAALHYTRSENNDLDDSYYTKYAQIAFMGELISHALNSDDSRFNYYNTLIEIKDTSLKSYLDVLKDLLNLNEPQDKNNFYLKESLVKKCFPSNFKYDESKDTITNLKNLLTVRGIPASKYMADIYLHYLTNGDFKSIDKDTKIIFANGTKMTFSEYIVKIRSDLDIVSDVIVENDIQYFQSWEDITGDPQYSPVSAKASLEEILQTKDINEMKRLLNEWQYKCMYLSYKNGSVIFTKDIVGNNVTFSLSKGEETLFIDDLLNMTTFKDYSDYTINAVDYKIQRKKENKDIYILNDEDQNVKNGWVYTDKIYRLMMKYFNGSRIDDKPPESTMSNEEMANIMTLISTRLTTEDEEKEGLIEILDKIEEAMNIIYTKEQKYDREDVNYSHKEYQKIRNGFEEWRNYYIPSPSEYFKTAEIMIWRPIELEMKSVEEIRNEKYDPQYIIDYYNNIEEKYKEEKKKKWVINEQDEKNVEVIIFEDASDSEYGEMMNEIQGARNRLQRYDSPNKLIVIMGTNYGDIYSVFGKEDLINVVPIETFFRIKNTNDIIYIPYDKRDSDTNWAIDKWLFTNLYDFIFEPMMYYINDSSPFKGLLESINDIRYLGYVMIKQEEKGMNIK
ncbi:hypothetical protein EHI8A_086060 [Entamoeba histolytica HM-1:IMSS-B]|uniref:Uncharacterized protein n=5 Tax=Entamoeba histolytica TaxID=5759 RepID=C4LZK2_ENTH1|nr:hypothetical protein EHI_174540 [Entamoeba histolytica HM-1:IMSS]EMH76838.1 hypothetical protein EHI8A_086060 [Entamoeba histolytica HM-1:IMSS-B]EMS13404.1 hypothetical protein KM1_102050 [Entamoeba histolytica HM-3:IMSS]ENY65824.1 hypothetical protein EHI7A_075780 [Entamoeba histolytica HM-1:IMSS-A]GAT94300.1 hypothetical protein CL6EHI_174540 [Entamoeba histolytica]EAL47938.2 hypothetical protein EHI_174540 [Entamoeba histolytica HM-1:IMSS]|eukprot:XP_653324.2 hypothetical protein EHI_174540 [Entamoeba histolytica HM-1:IMSS]